jgi:hypothetical protein
LENAATWHSYVRWNRQHRLFATGSVLSSSPLGHSSLPAGVSPRNSSAGTSSVRNRHPPSPVDHLRLTVVPRTRPQRRCPKRP